MANVIRPAPGANIPGAIINLGDGITIQVTRP